MAKLPLVCDTTLLLYLDRIGHVNLLAALFAQVCVPESVMLELDMGRLDRGDTIDPRKLAWITPVLVSPAAIDDLPPNRLGIGERAVIAYAHVNPGHIVGLDDLQARQLAERLNLQIVSTLGVLLQAKRANLIPAVRPLLDAVVNQGFRLTPDLYRDVLRLADEAT